MADIFAEQQALARRQQLLQAMQQQTQAPIQGKYGLAQMIAKIASGMMLNGADSNMTEQQSSLNSQRQEQLGGQMQGFLDAYNGQEGVKQFGATPEAPVTPDRGDPRAAIAGAMTSQFPEMQMMGKTMLPGMLKQQVNPLDYLKLGPEFGQSRVQAANGGGQAALKSGQEGMVVDKRVVDKYNPAQELADYSEKFSAPYFMKGASGPLLVKKNLLTGEVEPVDKTPHVNVGVSANILPKGETAFTEALGKDQAEAYKEARKQAEMGYSAKGMVAQLQKLEQSGVFNTPAPNAAILFGRIGSAIGIPVDQTKLANSEGYQQQIAKRVSEVLTAGSGVGRSMTDADREAFMQSLPQLMASPAGRQQVYAQLMQGADTAINRHKSMQQALLDSPTMAGYKGILTLNPVDENPGVGVLSPQVPPAPAGSGPLTLDAYLKKMRGGQ